jgi:hypothetical protein
VGWGADGGAGRDRCIDFAKDFIVSGTASDQLFGTCESLWEPDMVSVFSWLLWDAVGR